MKDETLDLLSSIGPITSRKRLETILAGQWLWLDRYGDEIVKLLAGMNAPPMKALPKKPRGKKRVAEVENKEMYVASAKRRIDAALTPLVTPSVINPLSRPSDLEVLPNLTTLPRVTPLMVPSMGGQQWKPPFSTCMDHQGLFGFVNTKQTSI
jgi:hypothetical protein